jgi:hypothetical protein
MRVQRALRAMRATRALRTVFRGRFYQPHLLIVGVSGLPVKIRPAGWPTESYRPCHLGKRSGRFDCLQPV